MVWVAVTVGPGAVSVMDKVRVSVALTPAVMVAWLWAEHRELADSVTCGIWKILMMSFPGTGWRELVVAL